MGIITKAAYRPQFNSLPPPASDSHYMCHETRKSSNQVVLHITKGKKLRWTREQPFSAAGPRSPPPHTHNLLLYAKVFIFPQLWVRNVLVQRNTEEVRLQWKLLIHAKKQNVSRVKVFQKMPRMQDWVTRPSLDNAFLYIGNMSCQNSKVIGATN
ncbi:UNVERIFIED_CONTAM: hypothetical protein K2H54_022369 [Gekko kuhli]